jgi:hypothetical protein
MLGIHLHQFQELARRFYLSLHAVLVEGHLFSLLYLPRFYANRVTDQEITLPTASFIGDWKTLGPFTIVLLTSVHH